MYATAVLTSVAAVSCSSDDEVTPNVREDIVLTGSSRAGIADFNRSAFQLYDLARQQADYKDANFVFSPLSASATLAMMANGANGQTLKEITDFLAQESTIDEINELCGQLLPALKTVDNQCNVSIVNSLWHQTEMQPLAEFSAKMQKYYGANIAAADFTKGKSDAIDAINRWVEKSTMGNINKLIEDFPTGSTYYVFANTMYFNGKWANDFTKSGYLEEFTTADGSKVSAPFMKNEELYTPFYMFEKGYAVTLPYGNKAFEMMIFVPGRDQSLDEFAQWLTPERYANLENEAVKCAGDRDIVVLEMPKFTINQRTHNMIPWLNKAGIHKAFDKKAADFLGISNYLAGKEHQITLFDQATKLEVNEKGTTATTGTAGAVGETTASSHNYFNFSIDRPFIFMIRETSTGVILFMGQVTNPTLQ